VPAIDLSREARLLRADRKLSTTKATARPATDRSKIGIAATHRAKLPGFNEKSHFLAEIEFCCAIRARRKSEADMSSSPKLDASVRNAIIDAPDAILDDQAVMHALIAANEKSMGGNIVDLRGIAMERLEARLDRLEDTHRSVIAAAYENLSGTNQVHRAILRMMDPMEFEHFLRNLGGEVAEILRVEAVTLVLESVQSEDDPVIRRMGSVLCVAEPGFIDDYIGPHTGLTPRKVTLRQLSGASTRIYGEASDWIRSEAVSYTHLTLPTNREV